MVDSRDRVSGQPLRPSQHYLRHFVFEKGALKHEIQIVQYLFVGGQFHINDMTITHDEKPVCLASRRSSTTKLHILCSFAARTGNTQGAVNYQNQAQGILAAS